MDLDPNSLGSFAESDARRLADGFVIVSNGRYLGMGTANDVVRALQSSRVLAARYTNPLTMLPGQVPINEHLERLLAEQPADKGQEAVSAPGPRDNADAPFGNVRHHRLLTLGSSQP